MAVSEMPSGAQISLTSSVSGREWTNRWNDGTAACRRAQ
jgi:hypothetical protein